MGCGDSKSQRSRKEGSPQPSRNQYFSTSDHEAIGHQPEQETQLRDNHDRNGPRSKRKSAPQIPTNRSNSRDKSFNKRELLGKYEEMKNINDKVTNDLSEMTNKYEEIEKKLQETEQNLKQNIYSNKKDENLLKQSHEKEKGQLQKRLDEKTQEIKRLTDETRDLRSKLKEDPQLNSKIYELSLKLKKQEKQNEETLDSKNRQINELTKQLQTAQSEIMDLKIKSQTPTPPLRKVTKDTQFNFENKQSKLPLRGYRSKTLTGVPMEDNEKTEFENNPFKLRELNTKLVTELKNAREENKRLTFEYNALQKTAQSNHTKLELKKLKGEMNEMQSNIENKERQISQLEKELEDTKCNYEKQIHEMKNELTKKTSPESDVQNISEKDGEKTNISEVDQQYVTESLKRIQDILDDSKNYEKDIIIFEGNATDKTYLHIEEMLIRNLVKLDNVESEGYTEIRKERKIVLQFVQKCLDDLKAKGSASKKPDVKEKPTVSNL